MDENCHDTQGSYTRSKKTFRSCLWTNAVPRCLMIKWRHNHFSYKTPTWGCLLCDIKQPVKCQTSGNKKYVDSTRKFYYSKWHTLYYLNLIIFCNPFKLLTIYLKALTFALIFYAQFSSYVLDFLNHQKTLTKIVVVEHVVLRWCLDLDVVLSFHLRMTLRGRKTSIWAVFRITSNQF